MGLKSAFDAYQKVQDAVQSHLGDVQSAILSPMDMMQKFLGETPSAQPRVQADGELDKLRKRLAELEARLEKPARRKHSLHKR